MKKCALKQKGIFQKICLNYNENANTMNEWFKTTFLMEVDSVYSKQWDMYFKDKIKESLNWKKQKDWEASFKPQDTEGYAFKKISAVLIKATLDYFNLSELEIKTQEDDIVLEGLVSNKEIIRGSQRKVFLFLTKDKMKMVLKVPIESGSSYKKIDDLTIDWKNYLIAQEIVKEFNKALSQQIQFQFLDLVILKLKKESLQDPNSFHAKSF